VHVPLTVFATWVFLAGAFCRLYDMLLAPVTADGDMEDAASVASSVTACHTSDGSNLSACSDIGDCADVDADFAELQPGISTAGATCNVAAYNCGAAGRMAPLSGPAGLHSPACDLISGGAAGDGEVLPGSAMSGELQHVDSVAVAWWPLIKSERV